jgi:hypothetical protein
MTYGWAGLAIDPPIYALIKVAAFVTPPDPGNVPVYPQFTTIQIMKTANHAWENARNHYLSYVNISRACFKMLNKLVPDHFKVSNNPNLLGLEPNNENPSHLCAIGVVVWQANAYNIVEQQDVHGGLFAK